MTVFDEIKEVVGTYWRDLVTQGDSPLGHNFRAFGPQMGAYEYPTFVRKAQEFFDRAANGEPGYKMISMSGNRVGIDLNGGELRGIFTEDGRPLSFYKPDHKAAGFATRQDELENFLSGAERAPARSR